MDKFSFELLSLVKEQFEKVIGNKKYQIPDVGKEFSARQFYFENLADNLFEPMTPGVLSQYSNGSGNELEDKMKALRSSSAMTYNLLGNDDIVLYGNSRLGAVKYSLQYEWQGHTLKAGLRGQPANIDAILVCKDTGEIIAAEMKMSEWIFNSSGKLKSVYLNCENYDDKEAGALFTEIANALIKPVSDYETDPQNQTEYLPFLTRYDGFQMFKHSVALYNACKEKRMCCKKLTLVNCVWEPNFPDKLSESAKEKYTVALSIEHSEFNVFYFEMQPVKNLFRTLGIDFDIQYYSLSDFAKNITLSEQRSAYLQRY